MTGAGGVGEGEEEEEEKASQGHLNAVIGRDADACLGSEGLVGKELSPGVEVRVAPRPMLRVAVGITANWPHSKPQVEGGSWNTFKPAGCLPQTTGWLGAHPKDLDTL